jgi:glycosyltransferase involved in cell wall biosynthesis
MPQITVIMPVYNGMPFLKDAVDSIINQDFQDFELIILNDASTDDSADFINGLGDPRIVKVHHSVNQGLINTLNEGLKLSRGKFIARMDQDDISYKHRFSRQLSFFYNNQNISMCGTFARIIGSDSILTYPTEHEELRLAMLELNPFIHPSTMFKSSIIKDYGLYYKDDYKSAEDYEFWFNMSSKVSVANVPEVLLDYRVHPKQISSNDRKTQITSADKVRFNAVESIIGRNLSEDEKNIHFKFLYGVNTDSFQMRRVLHWIEKLKKENFENGIYLSSIFNNWIFKSKVRFLKENFLWNNSDFKKWGVVIRNPFIFSCMSSYEWLYSIKRSLIKLK